MKILAKIIQCPNYYWYKDRIGEVFEVFQETELFKVVAVPELQPEFCLGYRVLKSEREKQIIEPLSEEKISYTKVEDEIIRILSSKDEFIAFEDCEILPPVKNRYQILKNNFLQ